MRLIAGGLATRANTRPRLTADNAVALAGRSMATRRMAEPRTDLADPSICGLAQFVADDSRVRPRFNDQQRTLDRVAKQSRNP